MKWKNRVTCRYLWKLFKRVAFGGNDQTDREGENMVRFYSGKWIPFPRTDVQGNVAPVRVARGPKIKTTHTPQHHKQKKKKKRGGVGGGGVTNLFQRRNDITNWK